MLGPLVTVLIAVVIVVAVASLGIILVDVVAEDPRLNKAGKIVIVVIAILVLVKVLVPHLNL